ncbi:MAG: Na/Pi cotransporter family protein [Prevotella sp.]|nr:Na/Pi cotransporter family protein [Prevotella sp.]
METPQNYLMVAFKLLGSLALLIFGMKLMSETLQKMAGPQLRHVLARMTTNRFTGMLTGVLVTATVQSSTATTVMTVSFVNAGLLTLAQAISVIMGANIGTTLTAWIMSMGFSFNITDFVWPAFIIAILLIYRKSQRNIGDFLFGIAFMFLGLGTLRQTGMDMNLGENETLLNFFASFDPQSFTTTLLFLLIGGVLTMCVQSSAAVMAITMILCSSGALPIYQGIALVMGENIGTTVTSNLAALTASTQARRAAFGHMFFNLFGVFWMLIVLRPFINGVCGLVGYDTEMTKETVDHAVFLANAAKLSVVLAAFHTCFNIVNTSVLIWFIPQIEKIVCKVIKDKKKTGEEQEDEEVTRLRYIDSPLVRTPELSVFQAQKETALFGTRMQRMFSMVRTLLEEKDDEAFTNTFERIEKYENISDNMELEIAKFLEKVSDAHLSDDTKEKIRQLLRSVSELESIGDACYNLGRILNRKHEGKMEFTEGQKTEIDKMLNLVDEALTQMNEVVAGRREEQSMDESFRLEKEINDLRTKIKADNIHAVNEHEYDYSLGTLYTDLISECEKLGDYIINVVEARLK